MTVSASFLKPAEGLMSFGMTGTPRGHRKLLENFVQLKVDNKLLSEENARLGSELAEVQHARGSTTTVPVPGEALGTPQADASPCFPTMQPCV